MEAVGTQESEGRGTSRSEAAGSIRSQGVSVASWWGSLGALTPVVPGDWSWHWKGTPTWPVLMNGLSQLQVEWLPG